MNEPTEKQLHILRHTIGLDQKGKGTEYRNYYCAQVSDPECEALCELGLMQRRRKINDDQDQYYHVTEAGRIMAQPRESEREKPLTKSQLRYRHYLHSELNMSFKEYLKSTYCV